MRHIRELGANKTTVGFLLLKQHTTTTAHLGYLEPNEWRKRRRRQVARLLQDDTGTFLRTNGKPK